MCREAEKCDPIIEIQHNQWTDPEMTLLKVKGLERDVGTYVDDLSIWEAKTRGIR